MPLDALILDVDVTLADTNAIHVRAFAAAFEKFGYHVDLSRIEPEIGKGGDHLIGAVLGAGAEREHGEAIRDALKPIFLRWWARKKSRFCPAPSNSSQPPKRAV